MAIRPFALRSILVTFLLVIQSAVLFAAEPPLRVFATFDLPDRAPNVGFFQLMAHPTRGIKAALDADFVRPVIVTDVKTFRTKATNFAHVAELEKKLKGGARGLDKLVSLLAGKEIPVDKMFAAVAKTLKANGLFAIEDPKQQSRLASAIVPIIAIASGKGVLVRLDRDNYCYNYGYAHGTLGREIEQDKQDRKSGRSYGASIERGAYDPSDNDYLRELSLYVAGASPDELRNFYRTVFEIILKSDTSGLRYLSAAGQTVVADFMAIYMAELDRHLMTGLAMYEWENALTEITMLAAYSAGPNGVTLDPRGGPSNENERGLVASRELVAKDRLLGFFGVGTDGSGLDGKNKGRRHAITSQVTRQQQTLSPEVVGRLTYLIGARPGVDLYDEVMNRVNSIGAQPRLQDRANELIPAIVEFVISTRAQAAKIKLL